MFYVAARKGLLRLLMVGPFDHHQEALRMIEPARVAAIRANHEMIGAEYYVEEFSRDHQPPGVLSTLAFDPITIIEASRKDDR